MVRHTLYYKEWTVFEIIIHKESIMIKNINKKVLATILIIACVSTGLYGFSSKASTEDVATSIVVDTDTHIGGELEEGEVFPEDMITEDESIEVLQVIAEDMGMDLETFIDYTGDDFISMDEYGNTTLIPYEDVETPDFDELDNVEEISVEDNGVATINTSATYGVVVFNDMSSSGSYTSYIDAVTGAPGYTNGTYGPDAAYLGLSSGQVKFMISGVTGLCDADKVTIYEYDDFVSQGYVTNTYTTKNGRLYHNITTNLKTVASTQLFGYQQSYMSSNATYYSYDGHYFYTSYKTMITDYKNGVFTNAINPKNPYYNYYLYLSHRTQTSFTAAEFNSYISSKTSSSTSKMLNTGSAFVSAQNSYGSNAALMFGLAMNESANGTSTIAQSKNNLFGHGAVDSNPYYGSTGYSTVTDSINYHAEYFVSRQYTDAKSDNRYYGPHLGNKESGFNVKYASDPYWGEKAAAHCFQMEDVNTATTPDYNKYQLGVVGGSTPMYNSPSGSILYYAKNVSYKLYNVPVVILDSITYNNVLWYKIQSDMPVVSGRGSVLFSQIYNFSNDYVYVKASLVTTTNDGTGSSGSTEDYMLGDPSGDGNITSLDYILVRNHIMGTSILTGNSLLAADPSGDGNITSLDYILIRNHIMGTSLIN